MFSLLPKLNMYTVKNVKKQKYSKITVFLVKVQIFYIIRISP